MSLPFTAEEVATFQPMEAELAHYNEGLGRGKKPPKPEYDLPTFRRFRDWQAKRLATKGRELDRFIKAG